MFGGDVARRAKGKAGTTSRLGRKALGSILSGRGTGDSSAHALHAAR